MAIDLTDVLESPERVAGMLQREVGVVTAAAVERNNGDVVVFRLTFFPEGVFAREGFPVEDANVWTFADGRVLTVPASGGRRSWRHRNGVCGDLCLWYDNDPPALRWKWSDGFEELVKIVYRHLVYEEVYRRTGSWPVEDAPHGHAIGKWPICTAEMRRAAKRIRP